MEQERMEALSKLLLEDEERARELLAMKAEDALARINALGHDFTVEELGAYAEAQAQAALPEGELEAEDLENVAGGLRIMMTPLGTGLLPSLVRSLWRK